MKVNEKIQYYRKKAGLSQEELAKRLLVSRQTVSLWETGQTLPTLDNLTRLREIFGVSIDELLIEEEDLYTVLDKNVAEPYEVYNFTYSKEEIKKIDRSAFLPGVFIFSFFFLLLAVCAVAVITTSKPRFEHGISLGMMLIMSILSSFIPINAFKDSRTTKSDRLKTDYTLLVFGDRFVLEKRMNSVLYDLRTVEFNRIKNITRGKDFLTLYVGSEIYNFKHTALVPSSLLYSVSPVGEKSKRQSSTVKKAAQIFFVLSLISIFISPVVGIVVMFTPAVWAWVIASVFILVSVLSIVFGTILATSGTGGGKSIITGIISLILIVTISFSLIGLAKYSPIEDAEYYIEIDLPDGYSGMSMEVVEEFYDDKFLCYRAGYVYEDEDVSEFESSLENALGWISFDEAAELLALCPEKSYYGGADYLIFYEYVSEEINYLPKDDEYASYILVAYFLDENMLLISEYDCNHE